MLSSGRNLHHQPLLMLEEYSRLSVQRPILTKLESRGVVILGDITAFWRERDAIVTEADLSQAIAKLVERELIRRDETRVAFTMGLIPAWIARCQSEQSVRQEVLK